ncbi:hypothetical protein TKK_0000175 [Trichogramma kaykai]
MQSVHPRIVPRSGLRALYTGLTFLLHNEEVHDPYELLSRFVGEPETRPDTVDPVEYRGLRTLLSRRVSWNLQTPQSLLFRMTTLSCLPSRLELKTQMAQWLFRDEIFNGLLPFSRFVKVSPTAPDSLAALAVLLDVSKYQVYFSILQ